MTPHIGGDALHRRLRLDRGLDEFDAELLGGLLTRGGGVDHAPARQHLPHMGETVPVVGIVLGRLRDMHEMKVAFRRHRDAQRMGESVLAGEGKVRRVDDGFGRLADHIAFPLRCSFANLCRGRVRA